MSIHSEDRPEWVILDMATVAVRAITVGLYPTNPAAEVEYLLSDSGSVVHLAEDQEQADKVMTVIDSLPDLRKIIHIEPRGFRKWQDDERFLSWTTSSSSAETTGRPTPAWSSRSWLRRQVKT